MTIQLHLMASVLAIEEQDLSTARRHIELLEEQMAGIGIPARAVAQLCCIALRIDAEIDQRARWVHDLPPLLGDDERRELLTRVHRAQSTASNPEIDALAATATAEYNRRQPVADPELWQRATGGLGEGISALRSGLLLLPMGRGGTRRQEILPCRHRAAPEEP